MRSCCCQDLIKHAEEMHKDTEWHWMKRDNIHLRGETNIQQRALIDSWKCSVNAALLIHGIAWAHAGRSRCSIAERSRFVFVNVGQLHGGPGDVHNNRPFLCPFSLCDAPRALIAIKTKCPSEAISALCGPYVWVLIERGLLCLGHR